jgi:hypothetical protein
MLFCKQLFTLFFNYWHSKGAGSENDEKAGMFFEEDAWICSRNEVIELGHLF